VFAAVQTRRAASSRLPRTRSRPVSEGLPDTARHVIVAHSSQNESSKIVSMLQRACPQYLDVKMPFFSRNLHSERAWMTWRAVSARPYLESMQPPLERRRRVVVRQHGHKLGGLRQTSLVLAAQIEKQHLRAAHHSLASSTETKRGRYGVNLGSTCTALSRQSWPGRRRGTPAGSRPPTRGFRSFTT
jgi:hypothetical protein